MLIYDANLREVTLSNGAVVAVPEWAAQAASDSNDPCRWVRFWLRSQRYIEVHEEVMTLDLSGSELTPVEALTPV